MRKEWNKKHIATTKHRRTYIHTNKTHELYCPERLWTSIVFTLIHSYIWYEANGKIAKVSIYHHLLNIMACIASPVPFFFFGFFFYYLFRFDSTFLSVIINNNHRTNQNIFLLLSGPVQYACIACHFFFCALGERIFFLNERQLSDAEAITNFFSSSLFETKKIHCNFIYGINMREKTEECSPHRKKKLSSFFLLTKTMNPKLMKTN